VMNAREKVEKPQRKMKNDCKNGEKANKTGEKGPEGLKVFWEKIPGLRLIPTIGGSYPMKSTKRPKRSKRLRTLKGFTFSYLPYGLGFHGCLPFS
jgi:hypothetical protein